MDANAIVGGIRDELYKAGLVGQLFDVLKTRTSSLRAIAAEFLVKLASYSEHLTCHVGFC
jgi:hypothetical protein